MNFSQDFYNYIQNLYGGSYKSGSVAVFYGKTASGKTTLLKALSNKISDDKKLKVLFLTVDSNKEITTLNSMSEGRIDVKVVDDKWNINDFNNTLSNNDYGAVVIDDLWNCINGYEFDDYILKKLAVKFNVPVIVSVNAYGKRSIDDVLDTIYDSHASEPLWNISELIVYLERTNDTITIFPIKNKWDFYDSFTL